MKHVPALLSRELGSYFLGPTAYLVLLAFQIIAFLNFWELVDSLSQPQGEFSSLRDPMSAYISGSTPFWIAVMVAVPALTRTLKKYLTALVGTPLSTPVTGSSNRLAGGVANQFKAPPGPFTVVNVSEYGAPTKPSGSGDGLVMMNGPSLSMT